MRESYGSTHSSSSCTQTIKNPAPLPFQAFATPLRSALTHMHKGRCTLRPNHKALCQRIMPLMNKVHTHEARVSHTIAPTISRHPSGGKYTLVSKGMVHQSFTHILSSLNLIMQILASFIYVHLLWFGCICTVHP